MKTAITALLAVCFPASAWAGMDCTTIGAQTHCYGSNGSYTSIFTTPGRTQVMSTGPDGNMDTTTVTDFGNPDQPPQPSIVIPVE